jgi:predicted RNA-binding protein YlqC (UPF0109 family)
VVDDQRAAYVGNLPWDATEDDVARLVGQFADVVSARIIIDKQTGRSRGYAFVELASAEQVATVCATLDGCQLNGRQLQVSPARPRPERRQSTAPRPLHGGGKSVSVRELVTAMLGALVDRPEQLVVSEIEGERCATYEVQATPDELGKLIGKRGRNADALRTVLRAVGTKEGKSIWINLTPLPGPSPAAYQ